MSNMKFRAWDNVSKCMLDWAAICQTAFNRDGDYSLMYKILTNQAKPNDNYGFHVMLCTDFQDKNDKDIYEGDVLGTKALRCVVERCIDGEYVFRFLDSRIRDIPITDRKVSVSAIVGNKFDNPELLQP